MLLGGFWHRFPIGDGLHDALAAFLADKYRSRHAEAFLLEDSSAAFAILTKGAEDVVYPVPEVEKVPVAQILGFGAVATAFLIWCWMWLLYLATTRQIGMRPWQVRWSVLTCAAATFWSVPIVATAAGVLVKRGLSRFLRAARMVLTTDLGRAVGILLGRKDAIEIALTEGLLAEEALSLSYRRLGEIGMELTDLEFLKTQAEEEAVGEYEKSILLLSREREGIEAHIRAFPGSEVTSDVSPRAGATLHDVFVRRIEALHRVNPAIPPLPLPKGEIENAQVT